MKRGSYVLRCCGEGCTVTMRVGMGVKAFLCRACANRGIGDRIKRAVEAQKKKEQERASA